MEERGKGEEAKERKKGEEKEKQKQIVWNRVGTEQVSRAVGVGQEVLRRRLPWP